MKIAPESRGACITVLGEFEAELEHTVLQAHATGRLGALVLVRIEHKTGHALSVDEQIEAALLLSRLARQVDHLAPVTERIYAVVVHRLGSREDGLVLVERMEDVMGGKDCPWVISWGLAIFPTFPLSAAPVDEVWTLARADLDGGPRVSDWLSLDEADEEVALDAG